MLNSDWPIGPVGVRTLAAPDKVESIEHTMEELWWDRPFALDGVDVSAGAATLHLTSSYGAQQAISIHTNDETLVDRFDVTTETPKISSWRDVDATLGKTGARYAYQAAKVDDGHCERVAGTNAGVSLPLASIFKLYVLYAVADAVKAGTVSWDDELVVTAKAKAVGSSGLDKLPEGAHVSVRTAAEKMIATSDNMATDLLIGKVGNQAVEKALAATGHHDPASMTPFPTMHELFSIGWGQPDLRQQWQKAGRYRSRGTACAGQSGSLSARSDPGARARLGLWRGVVRQRRGYLPRTRSTSGRRSRRRRTGAKDLGRRSRDRTGSQ